MIIPIKTTYETTLSHLEMPVIEAMIDPNPYRSHISDSELDQDQ